MAYLSTQEAADYLGLKKGTLEVWRCYGRGPRFIRLGRRVVYSKTDLDKYAQDNAVLTIDSLN